jgi:hypothetical protein
MGLPPPAIPATLDYTTYDPVTCSLALPNPRTRTNLSPRLRRCNSGRKNTLTVRYQYYDDSETNSGPGQLNLVSTAYNSEETEQHRTDQRHPGGERQDRQRDPLPVPAQPRSTQTPVEHKRRRLQVQGAFSDGGSSAQFSRRQSPTGYEVQNYTSIALKVPTSSNSAVACAVDRDSNTDNSATTTATSPSLRSPVRDNGLPHRRWNQSVVASAELPDHAESALAGLIPASKSRPSGYGPSQFTLTARRIPQSQGF